MLAKIVGKFATSVADTGGKFAAGVVDTDGKLPPASLTPTANLPPVSLTPEYVILEDFNFTLGRLYPRYKSTPARFVPGVYVKFPKCHILDDFSHGPPPPPAHGKNSVIHGFFRCEGSDHLYPGYLYLHELWPGNISTPGTGQYLR